MANVVGGAVVFTVSAVVPLVVARGMLALLMGLMVLGRRDHGSRPTQR